jgi:hypothetical protein
MEECLTRRLARRMMTVLTFVDLFRQMSLEFRKGAAAASDSDVRIDIVGVCLAILLVPTYSM